MSIPVERYRPTMSLDVLRLWAAEAQTELDYLRDEVTRLKTPPPGQSCKDCCVRVIVQGPNGNVDACNHGAIPGKRPLPESLVTPDWCPIKG